MFFKDMPNGALDKPEVAHLLPNKERMEEYHKTLMHVVGLNADTAAQPEFLQATEQALHGFLSLGGETQGTRHAHAMRSEFLFPLVYAQAGLALYHKAMETKNQQLLMDVAQVMFLLQAAWETIVVARANRRHIPVSESLASMMRAYADGGYDGMNLFATMRIARKWAIQCIEANQELIPELATAALQLHREAHCGLSFGSEFLDQLEHGSTKALVLSLDFNGIWNVSESFPDQVLVGHVMHSLAELAEAVRVHRPGLQLFVILNTGRPAMYLWGAMETMQPLPCLRQFAIAEAGGVVLTDIHDGIMTVAVNQPDLWESELSRLRAYLFSKLCGRPYVETKISMLSIRVAEKLDQGGKHLVFTVEGEKADEVWFQNQIKQFLNDRQVEIQQMVQQSKRRISPEGEASEELQDLLLEVGAEATSRIQQLIAERAVLREMTKHLKVDFNVTAGYVDIHHDGLNKYTTLRRELESRGHPPEACVIVHIGDSTTDLMPETDTGPGGVNYGADLVWLVAAGNANGKLRAAVQRRGSRGIQSVRDCTLALQAMILGVTKAVKKTEEVAKNSCTVRDLD